LKFECIRPYILANVSHLEATLPKGAKHQSQFSAGYEVTRSKASQSTEYNNLLPRNARRLIAKDSIALANEAMHGTFTERPMVPSNYKPALKHNLLASFLVGYGMPSRVSFCSVAIIKNSVGNGMRRSARSIDGASHRDVAYPAPRSLGAQLSSQPNILGEIQGWLTTDINTCSGLIFNPDTHQSAVGCEASHGHGCVSSNLRWPSCVILPNKYQFCLPIQLCSPHDAVERFAYKQSVCEEHNGSVLRTPGEQDNLLLSQFIFFESFPFVGRFIQKKLNKLVFRRAKPFFLLTGNEIMVDHKQFIYPNELLFSFYKENSKTGDIVQGLPKINRFFEGRSLIKLFYFLNKEIYSFKSLSTTDASHLESAPHQTTVPFRSVRSTGVRSTQKEHNKNHLTTGNNNQPVGYRCVPEGSATVAGEHNIIKTDELKSFDFFQSHHIWCQLSLFDKIQQIYESQGISIHNKHIELILKGMTDKVLLVQSSDFGFLAGDFISFYWLLVINSYSLSSLFFTPFVLGVTKVASRKHSFLSSSSFQETKSVLLKNSFSQKTDFVKGLKEHVILAKFLPLGAGFQDFSSLSATQDSTIEKYFDYTASNGVIPNINGDISALRSHTYPARCFETGKGAQQPTVAAKQHNTNRIYNNVPKPSYVRVRK
jgi:hypothetical protein